MLGNPVSCRGHNHITYKYRLKGDSFIFIKLTQTSNSSADSLLRFVVLVLGFLSGLLQTARWSSDCNVQCGRFTELNVWDNLQLWTLYWTLCTPMGFCWDVPEAMNLLWSASYADTVYQSCHSRLWSSTDFWIASFVHQWLYNIN